MARPVAKPLGKQPKSIVDRALDRDAIEFASTHGNRIDVGAALHSSGMKGLGENLREARERKGMTQRQAAAMAGISTSTIQRLESNRSMPSLEKISVLATVYGVHIEWILGYMSDEEMELLDIYSDSSHFKRSKILQLARMVHDDASEQIAIAEKQHIEDELERHRTTIEAARRDSKW